MARNTGSVVEPKSNDVRANLSIGLCNCSALRKAARRISKIYDDALDAYGIKIGQRSILEHIAQAGAPTISELADLMVMDRTAITRALQPLERNGWVKTLVNRQDRRLRHVSLTNAGQAKLTETFQVWRGSQDKFERVFGKGVSAELRDALNRIAALGL